MRSIIFWFPMAARHNILPTFCRFLWWQLGKQFLEQKGCDRWPFYPPQCSISQSGDFCTLPYGHKREKNREKVQNEREARGKYRTEQVKMDIKQRKARKKVQNERETREKHWTEQVKMDIRPRKAVKKSKNIRKPEGNTEPGRRK